MAKKYSEKLVTRSKQYSIIDICNLFKDKKLHENTVRRWIKKCGLITAGKYKNEILISGNSLKDFLINHNHKDKNQLNFDEFKCRKCGIVKAKGNFISKIKNQSKMIILYANCENCNQTIPRFYSYKTIAKLQNTFVFESNVLLSSNSLCSISNAHSINEPKTMLSEQMVLKTKKINKDNEVVKYAFRRHLTKMQKDPKTIIQYINAINEFEISTNFKNFKTFNENQAVNFITYITNKKNAKTGRIVSK